MSTLTEHVGVASTATSKAEGTPRGTTVAPGLRDDIDARVYSEAKRAARYYGINSPSDVQRLEDATRYRLFRQAIEPYERFRNKPLLDYFRLQTRPGPIDPETYPDWLKEHLALWNGMIASEARKYGLEAPSGSNSKPD